MQPIMRWLYAGPFMFDVSALYHDNYTVPVEPYLPFINRAKEQLTRLKAPPSEGKTVEYSGVKKEWAWVRVTEADKSLIWASMGTSARLMITYGYTRILSDKGGRCCFNLDLTGAVSVFFNHQMVFEVLQVGRVSGNYSFEVDLLPGENHCVMLLANVHLHCVNSFSLFPEQDCTSMLPLLAGENRKEIEEDFGKFFLDNDLLHAGDTVCLRLSGPVTSRGKFIFSVYTVPSGRELEGELLLEKSFSLDAKTGDILLCRADELDQKPVSQRVYQINIAYEYRDVENAKPRILRGPGLPFRYADFFQMGGSGVLNFPERKTRLITWYEELRETDERTVIHRELVKLIAGNSSKIDAAAVEYGMDYINNRYDCADFALHGLLRLYWKYGNSNAISGELRQKMRACILNFKYWTDEPGKSMMFTRSENHEFLFFSAEYLAGLLFPAEIFPNSGQNGLFHALKGRLNAERWIKEKGRYGFMEWHSNCYYEEDMLGLLNIYDFGEENMPVRTLAKNTLDLICFIIASHHFQGILSTTHGRSYEHMIIHPELESMSHINWLLFGQPDRLVRRIAIGALALASSRYQPDPLFEEIAQDNGELHTISCMGLFPHSGTGGVNCSTYRTRDYMVSGMVESKAGEFGHQVHAGQVTLDGKLPVFVTCFDNRAENTRPSYWGGQYRNPKTIAWKNILAYVYRIKDASGFTHCYFPFKDFDETAEQGKWVFGRKNGALIALYSLKPFSKTTEGIFKDRELLCLEKSAIWFIETGRMEDYGSFAQFKAAMLGAALEDEGENLSFESPSNGMVKLGWDRVCTIKGTPVLEQPFPLIHNSYGHAEYGGGLFKLYHQGQEKILNFNF